MDPSSILVLLVTVCLNIYLYVIIPKGFFPQQDTGRLVGGIQADQSISFQAMRVEARRFHGPLWAAKTRPCENVVGFTGGAQRNSGFMFVALKPLSRNAKRDGGPGHRAPAHQAGQGARRQSVPAAGAGHPHRRTCRATRNTNTRCRPTTWPNSATWETKIRAGALVNCPSLPTSTPISRTRAFRPRLVIDRETASRLGVTAQS